MLPDIAVLFDSKPVCVVEIGYTRPEKLSAYRAMGIPDVRWYDKRGRLHSEVQRQSIHARAELAPPEVVYLYGQSGNCPCEQAALLNFLECDDCTPDLSRALLDRYERRFGLEALGDKLEQRREDGTVCTWILTDYVRVWFPTLCDDCGHWWLPEDRAFDLRVLLDATTRDLADQYGGRHTLSWDEAVEMFDDLELRADNGLFIRPEHEEGFERQVRVRFARG
jgi:hypothetical protein